MKIIEQAKKRFREKIMDVYEKSAHRVFITVDKNDIRAVLAYMFSELKARFSIATGVDTRLGIELLYHMAFDEEQVLVTVKTLVDKPGLEIDSITSVVPAAEWIEREVHEMFGVKFIGHPGLKTLLLPDDWPSGVYPLRKNSFESEKENTEREV